MINRILYFLFLAAICLFFGQATAISENFTSEENGLVTLENNTSTLLENIAHSGSILK